jgi:hypothetical protein
MADLPLNYVLVQLGGGPGEPLITIKITDNGDGTFKFDIDQTAGAGGVIGDLRGVFFDIGGDKDDELTSSTTSTVGKKTVTTTESLITATSDNGSVTGVQAGNDSVTDLGNGSNMNGATSFNGTGAEAKGYDVGVAIGTAGIGKDDIQDTSFTLGTKGSLSLSLSDFIGMDFGVRLTSVGPEGGSRDGSLKLTSSSFQPINDGDEPLDCVFEDSHAIGDAVADSIVAGPNTVYQSVTKFSLDGGVTWHDAGSTVTLPDTFGAKITFNANGTYDINAEDADALTAADHIEFSVLYEVDQVYKDASGDVIGRLTDKSTLSFDVCGLDNDGDGGNGSSETYDGLSQGYWAQHADETYFDNGPKEGQLKQPSAWNDGYDDDSQTYEGVFGVNAGFTGAATTLQQAMSGTGGSGEEALAKQAVAAILNSADGEQTNSQLQDLTSPYRFSDDEVILAVKTVYGLTDADTGNDNVYTSTMGAHLKGALEFWNLAHHDETTVDGTPAVSTDDDVATLILGGKAPNANTDADSDAGLTGTGLMYTGSLFEVLDSLYPADNWIA